MNEQQLKKEDMADYTDFQQAQILMTLIWGQIQEKQYEINSDNFVRATHSMEINNLIEILNDPTALSSLITAIRYGSHPYLTEANSSPSYSCKDLIDKSYFEDIIHETATSSTLVKAIGQYIERYYPYRTEAVWSTILQQNVEDLQKIFFNRGAIHNIIISSEIDTQYVKPYIVNLTTDTEHLVDGNDELMIPNSTIKLKDNKSESNWQQARTTITAALIPFVKKHYPEQSNKLQQIITVARGVKLHSLLYNHGVLNDWAYVVKNFDPKPWITQSQDDITAALVPSEANNPQNKTPSSNVVYPVK
jgi:hypothetical protein